MGTPVSEKEQDSVSRLDFPAWGLSLDTPWWHTLGAATNTTGTTTPSFAS